jgi:hypothetical protein
MDPTQGRGDIEYDLSLDRLKELFSEDFIRGLDKMFACGDYGDPAVAKECLAIFEWFKDINPNIVLGMNTNGGVRNTKFWKSLAEIMYGPLDYVVFSIDGLEDTNHIYRVNVQWKKLMENVQAYIGAGGKAHWNMLTFAHNEHQVEECRAMAEDMGFNLFLHKVSSRFLERPIEFLKPPKGYNYVQPTGKPHCHALEEKSLYVAATGQLLPCCFLGNEIFDLDDTMKTWLEEKDYVTLENSLTTNPHKFCLFHCGTYANAVSRHDNQFQDKV